MLVFFGCGDKGTDIDITPANGKVITLDDFNDGNAQNNIGKILGDYKVANMSDTDKSVDWGGGHWYAYASDNGAKVISGNGDTLIDSADTTCDDAVQIAKLMANGRLAIELNCQSLSPSAANDGYWAGIGCDLAGDAENPFKYDSVKYTNDSAIYWDLSKMDSIRITAKGTGEIMFFFESYAVKHFFTNSADAWGYHGAAITLSALDKTYSISVKDLALTNPDIQPVISWDAAKTAISGFAIELNTEKDNYADLEIDKIEFVSQDTTFALPF
jgi:hypothetical protein